MIEPELYLQSGLTRLKYIEDLLNKSKGLYSWKSRENILDFGSGTGEVTTKIHGFCLQSTHPITTGVDVSEEMVSYANKNYASHDTKFKVVDGEADLNHLIGQESFDKIFSVYALHCFSSDARKACKNLYDLLKDNGHLTLHFVTKVAFVEIIEKLKEEPQWSPYLKNFKLVGRIFQNMEEPHAYMKELLTDIGFKIQHMHKDHYKGQFRSIHQLIDMFQSITPYLCEVPKSKLKDYLSRVKEELTIHEDTVIKEDGSVTFTWYNLVIVAKK